MSRIQELTDRSLVYMEDIAELYGNMSVVQNQVALIASFDTRIDATLRALQGNMADLLETVSTLQRNSCKGKHQAPVEGPHPFFLALFEHRIDIKLYGVKGNGDKVGRALMP